MATNVAHMTVDIDPSIATAALLAIRDIAADAAEDALGLLEMLHQIKTVANDALSSGLIVKTKG